MGQCISRGHPGSYAFARHYDSQSLGSIYNGGYRHTWGGHSESKGARKREKSAGGNGNSKPSRGVATSFGFRRRPASTSRADDNSRRKGKTHDKNGNGGSTEDLRPEEVLSGRSTPLARPRKDTAMQQLRSNRFGFRQPTLSKTAKVGDVNVAAEQAFGVIHKDKETAINNNALDKRSTNPYSNQLLGPQVSSTGMTTIVGAAGVPKTVTKTVILTYQPQQFVQEARNRPPSSGPAARSSSVTRYGVGPVDQKPPGKYTFQTNQLPRPQYPAVKNVDTKSAKQVANSTRKVSGNSEGWREGAGSAVSTDSGVWTGGEGGGGGELSPRAQRRPRNLEMVMKGNHSFHLRELQVADLDIMDEAVVTGHTVIPLPKMPSLFGEERSPEYEIPAPTYKPPSPVVPKPAVAPLVEPENCSSPMSTLERYRTRTRPTRIQTSMMDSKEEEKFVFDRAQPESLKKQNSFTKSSSGVVSPPTVSSSKESSPSSKSEESNFGNSTTETWQAHAAGEAMATRSQDDVSIALSVSSCEDDKSKQEVKEYPKLDLEMPKKMIVIMDEAPAPHPLLMKSLTLSQHDSLRGSMMGSMTSSNYSTTSTCTNQSGDLHNLTLTLEESKFDISALETSTQSLLDDETSPADSLISSTSTNSDSNNDIQIERDATISSSAYQTANTKTKSPEPIVEEDGVDGEALQPVKENMSGSGKGENCKDSPESPGTPTHASGSLSLSDGRDFFDDEIADQPALLFRKNTDGSPSLKTVESDASKQLRRSRERINQSPMVQRNRKIGGGRNERTPSLDTLSSLASDDLMMMDNELAQSITSLQSVDDYIERLDSSLRSGLNSLDERQLHQELSSSKNAVRQWSQLLEQSNMLDRQLAAMASGKSAPHSLSTSTTSLTNIGASLPVRTARLLQRSRAQTPSDVGISDGSPSPGPAPASLLQDVVDIKTLLLQLKRVLQESETLDPLLLVCAESPRGNGRRPLPASPLHPDACAEMRRQILYLQSQLEERDRLVKVLQTQMLRMAESHEATRTDDTCNVATQTDRLRPPMSTTLTTSENSGLVSWNEQVYGRKLPSYSEAQKTKRSVTNGSIPIKCTCGARKNGLTNGNDFDIDKTDTIQLKNNSRVGSKYLQALANNSDNNRRYIKRDSSVGEKTVRKSLLYSTRSKSIENFNNQVYSTKESGMLTKNILLEESNQIKHHTSYGDLYNGCISSKESVNGNRHSPSLNGQSTDTDYSSDGGYKSLPSSINYTGPSPKKVSGIPRRSIEQKFISAKSVKASAI